MEAIRWNAKWYFGSFASMVGLFFLMFKFFDYALWRSIKYGIAIFVFTFLIKLLYQYILAVDRLEHKVEAKNEQIELLDTAQTKKDLTKKYNFYGEVLISLKDAFAMINRLKRVEKLEQKDISTVLVRTSNKIKHLFEKRLNYVYAVSIKVIELNADGTVTENSELRTIIRDEESYFKRKDNVHNGTKHTIFENSCFYDIFRNIESPSTAFYFSNNLLNQSGYKNSSFKDYGSIPRQLEDTDVDKHWTLPYKSEIVVPISPFLNSNQSRINAFYGYLCIDCDEPDGFHRKYDIGILLGVADGIYDLLEKWYLLKNKTND